MKKNVKIQEFGIGKSLYLTTTKMDLLAFKVSQ